MVVIAVRAACAVVCSKAPSFSSLLVLPPQHLCPLAEQEKTNKERREGRKEGGLSDLMPASGNVKKEQLKREM